MSGEKWRLALGVSVVFGLLAIVSGNGASADWRHHHHHHHHHAWLDHRSGTTGGQQQSAMAGSRGTRGSTHQHSNTAGGQVGK